MSSAGLEALVAANRDLFHARWRGIEFGSGWGELFVEMLDRCRNERPPLITASKEKFGSLRLYFEDQSHLVGRTLREEAMRRSGRICEMCGAEGVSLIITAGVRGTRCPTHRDIC